MIYLDSNATTQVHPEVLEEMLPFLTEHCHNPSSGYRAGKLVKKAVVKAREQVAALIGAAPEEIVFTSGGTEANTSAIHSVLESSSDSAKRRIVTSQIEHSSVLRVCEALEKRGYRIERVGVDAEGRLDLAAWEAAVSCGDVALATLMWANNETGVIQPVEEAAALAHAAAVPFHTDAIQAVGKTPLSVTGSAIDFLSISGHKFHAPKGVGALYIRNNVAFNPLLLGGGQEGGRRSGTENVASIVALGKAAEMMQSMLGRDGHDQIAALRDHFEQRLSSEVEGVSLNGSREYRVKNTSHLSFANCEAAGLLILLDQYGMQCSAGSACMTGKQQASHVQTAMGIGSKQAKSSLRVSFSLFTTKEETDQAVEYVKKAVRKLRSVQGSSGVGPVTVYT
ncbi:cysteine desulfurase family protein [Rubritalea marina]|uniref:cysteine desulfurase family protein n=1 Tax=Rubritalea marina TaxID=361055 RepID=UPI000378F726|nr:aminotransferase class V-fold PLP-dependent enzyme [Rubritalea marina]